MISKKDNPWYLNNLSYAGKLYHYTGEAGYRGIIDPSKNFDNNISLRLTRIDCGAKDPLERKHIQETVQKVADQLRDEGCITATFHDLVKSYTPAITGSSMYTTDSLDCSTHVPQRILKMDWGENDYYIGCFSTNPENQHIKTTFHTTRKITFSQLFSALDDSYALQDVMQNGMHRVNYYNQLHPCKFLSAAFLDFYMKKVLYRDDEKEVLVKEALLEIFNSGDDWEKQLGMMYYLYDGFFKAKEFEPEEEVRLLVKVPRLNQYPKFWEEEYNIEFEDEEYCPRKYLYLPISMDFLEQDSVDNIQRDRTRL